jgi:F420-dependent oxidoreductase-like protein
MRFAIWPNLQQPPAEVLALARHAEQSGWDGIYVADHFMGDGSAFGPATTPNLEATGMLAALAATVPRVRLGSLVFGMTYRHPAVLANWAATVDHVSSGRLVLGVGAGWQENEHEQYGIELPRPGPRLDRFAEACEIMQGMLRQDRTTVVGRYFTVRDALCEPKPVQEPLPLLVGGKGDRMLGIVARYADEWNMWGLPATIAERAAVLDRRCEEIGRDPSSIRRSAQALVFLTDDDATAASLVERVAPRAAIGGTAEQVAEVVAAWRDVGLDEVIVPDFTLGSGVQRLERMDEIIEQVAPAFR